MDGLTADAIAAFYPALRRLVSSPNPRADAATNDCLMQVAASSDRSAVLLCETQNKTVDVGVVYAVHPPTSDLSRISSIDRGRISHVLVRLPSSPNTFQALDHARSILSRLHYADVLTKEWTTKVQDDSPSLKLTRLQTVALTEDLAATELMTDEELYAREATLRRETRFIID